MRCVAPTDSMRPDTSSFAGVLRHLFLTVAAACSLRLGVVASTWLHEAAHLLAAVVFDKDTARNIVTSANLTCKRPQTSAQRNCTNAQHRGPDTAL